MFFPCDRRSSTSSSRVSPSSGSSSSIVRRHLAGAWLGHLCLALMALRLPRPRQPARHRPALEPAAAAVPVPAAAAADDGRPRRARRGRGASCARARTHALASDVDRRPGDRGDVVVASVVLVIELFLFQRDARRPARSTQNGKSGLLVGHRRLGPDHADADVQDAVERRVDPLQLHGLRGRERAYGEYKALVDHDGRRSAATRPTAAVGRCGRTTATTVSTAPPWR